VGAAGDFATDAEIIIDAARVLRAGWRHYSHRKMSRAGSAAKAARPEGRDRTRILVPPTLVIESVSPGHEAHDRQTKKRWYAEFGVPSYWVLDAFARSLECYRLEIRRIGWT